ncbi:MAG: hypothetical protein GF381_01100 [Candidatus Pacebacteria bacterium]|nr:hypothetical protein [Candidatus Paceibacterota bacterium]
MIVPRLKLHQFLFISFAFLLFLVNLIVFQITGQAFSSLDKTIQLIKPAPVPVGVRTAGQAQALDKLKKHELVAGSSGLLNQTPAGGTATVSGLTTQAYLVTDLQSACPLLQYNQDKKLYPASTVKLMTALVARETFHQELVLMVQPGLFVEGHSVGFVEGEKISVSSLIKALLINSGNDAAVILARHHPHGQAGFVKAMNQKAQDLGLNSTYFVNPSGLDHSAQQTTARDLTILAKEVLKDPFLASLVATPKTKITDLSGLLSHELFNTNQLLIERTDVFGLKTGTTELAGQVLITLVERDGHQVLIVVMGSEDRYADTTRLIDQTFSEYQWQEIN